MRFMTKNEALVMEHIYRVVTSIPIGQETDWYTGAYSILLEEFMNIEMILSNTRIHRAFYSFKYIYDGYGQPSFNKYNSWPFELKDGLLYLLEACR